MKLLFNAFWCSAIVLMTPVYLAGMCILFCVAAPFHVFARIMQSSAEHARMHLHISR